MNLFAKKSVLGILSTAALGAGLAAGPVAINTASAALVGSPNMQKYCNRYHFPSRALFVYQRNRWECVKYTGRLSRLYYRVNYALACRLSHNTSSYRIFGASVRCERRGFQPTRTGRLISPDLRRYCWRAFQTGQYAFHRGRNRYVCVKRRHYSQAYYFINMRAACYYTRNTTRVTYLGRSPRHPRCII